MNKLSKRGKLVGEFIKTRRGSKGLSQRSLGLLFSPPVTTQFISNIERGVTPLPPSHIPFLAKILLVDEREIADLLKKEYSFKLNGSIGISQRDEHESMGGHKGYDFIKKLYDAYHLADPKTKVAFIEVCQNLLNVPIAHSTFKKL